MCDRAVEPVRGKPDSQQLDLDLLFVDLGVAAVPVLDLKPVDEGLDQRGVEGLLAEIVEVGLGHGRRGPGPRVLPASVSPPKSDEAGLGDGSPDDLVHAGPDGAGPVGDGHHRTIWPPGMERSIMPLAVSPSHVYRTIAC